MNTENVKIMFTVVETTNFDDEILIDGFETKKQAEKFLAEKYKRILQEESNIVDNDNEGDFAYVEYDDADQIRWSIVRAEVHI